MSLKNQKKEALTASTSMNQEMLKQLKKDLLTKGGLIQDTTDARSHLDMTGLTAPDTMITTFNIAKILLSLVQKEQQMKRSQKRLWTYWKQWLYSWATLPQLPKMRNKG